MIMAAVIWFLGLLGVAPSEQAMEAMVDDYRLRGHHLTFTFNGFRGDQERKPGWMGLGYEYYADRRYHAVSFEVFGLVLGRPFQEDEHYWVAGGIGYYPVRAIKIFVQAGPLFQVNNTDVLLHGRVGLGYDFEFFVTSVMPFVTIGATNTGEFIWSIGARISV